MQYVAVPKQGNLWYMYGMFCIVWVMPGLVSPPVFPVPCCWTSPAQPSPAAWGVASSYTRYASKTDTLPTVYALYTLALTPIQHSPLLLLPALKPSLPSLSRSPDFPPSGALILVPSALRGTSDPIVPTFTLHSPLSSTPDCAMYPVVQPISA